MKAFWKKSSLVIGVLAAFGAVWLVNADQDYPSSRGNSNRDGLQSGDLLNSSPGRLLLRWFDPTAGTKTLVDNWEASTLASPANAWMEPLGSQRAFEVVESDPGPGRPQYLFAYPTPAQSPSVFWDVADASKKATFEWHFTTTPGQFYALFVNIPTGPTDVDATQNGPAGAGTYYPAQYYAYEITGINRSDGSPGSEYQLLDTYVLGGGEIRLGNNGLNTDRLFEATGTQITIRLINSIPMLGPNQPADTRQNIVLYADAAKALKGYSVTGKYDAAPIAGRLTDTASNYPYRVYAGRNEDTVAQVGSTIRSFGMASVSSFRHNGLKVDPAENGVGGEYRRNVVWSWPVKRPLDGSPAEQTRYSTDKANWVLGKDLTTPVIRANQIATLDSASIGSQAGAGYTQRTDKAGSRKGIDYYTDPITLGGNDRFYFRPLLSYGSYSVDVWSPGDNNFATKQTVELYRGGLLLGSAVVNMTEEGWHRISIGGVQEFSADLNASLEVHILNRSALDSEVGRLACADMVRFTKTADLRMTASPVFARNVPVNDGGSIVNRDVVIVPLENGHIYCLDAEGVTGGAGGYTGATKMYWSWPSEAPEGADPNQTAAIDGPDGIALMPTSFGSSAPLIQQVPTGAGNEWRVFIAATNGRVYAISATGNGDGTTTRRWTWPSDYPSTTPDATNVGEIKGSVTYGVSSDGSATNIPTIFIPAPLGRVYAVNAAGDATTLTTNTIWTYPRPADAPLGSLITTPVFSALGGTNRLFVGAASTLYALDTTDSDADGVGNLLWQTVGDGPGGAFGQFSYAPPIVVPSATVGGGMPNTLFVASSNRSVYAYDLDGNIIWSELESLDAGPSDGIGFTYRNNINNLGTLDYNGLTPPTPQGRPVLIVPTVSGAFEGIYARTADVNKKATRKAFVQQLANGAERATSPAFVGSRNINITPVNITDARYDDDYTFMAIADSTGYLYAFGDDPDLPDSDLINTPGEPPIPPKSETNDNTNDFLETYFGTGSKALVKVTRIFPTDFEKLRAKGAGGAGIVKSDITAITGKGAVTRTTFDFGETVYVMVYPMPDPNVLSPAVNYSVFAELTTTGRSARSILASRYTIVDEGDTEKNQVGLVAFSLQPNGSIGILPGVGKMNVTVTGNQSGVVGQTRAPAGASLILANDKFVGTREVNIAHPFGLSRTTNPGLNTVNAANQIGIFDNPAATGSSTELLANGNPIGYDIPQPYAMSRASLNNVRTLISHGQSAESVMYGFDRSLTVLLLGQRIGLQNVRVQTRDLNWNLNGATDPKNTVVKPFTNSALSNFEDYPSRTQGQNISLDYPDIRKDTITAARNYAGESQNPTFQQVSLEAPLYSDADYAAYRDGTTYNTTLARTLQPTEFSFTMNVPKYQPPNLVQNSNPGYFSTQYVYVDSNALNGVQVDQDLYRSFTSVASIGIDERILIGTPTIDLGSLPGGAGYSPGNPTTNPNLFSNFTNANAQYAQSLVVLNDGNVNLLNVRLAKRLNADAYQLYGPTMNNNVWLNATEHLHSELDPFWSDATFGRRNVSQKSRVGDASANRLRRTPIARGNPNLGVGDPGSLPFDDPRIAVSVPIGTPSGSFMSDLVVVEERDPLLVDTVPGLDRISRGPDVYEAYSEPGFTLKYSVRETRLTSRATFKAAPMVDDLGFGFNQRYTWSNQEPTMLRDGLGNVAVAFASNRLLSNAPAWQPDVRTQDQTNDSTYLYFASLNGGAPNGSASFPNPLNDLDQFAPSTGRRWFIQNGEPYPKGNPTDVFGYLAASGLAIDAKTVRYGLPSFSSSGVFNPLAALNNRTGNTSFIAFIGEGMKADTNGVTRERESRLFIASASVSGNAQIAVSNPIPLGFRDPDGKQYPVDPQAKFGKPSVIQVGSNATVFYPTTSGGLTQINWALFDGQANEWVRANGQSATGSLRLGSAFESVGSVSAVLRRQTNREQQRGQTNITLAFTGKLRGRSQSDVYLSTINANGLGQPASTSRGPRGSVILPWETRVDTLVTSDVTATYWGRGAELREDTGDVEVSDALAADLKTKDYATPNESGTFIDIMRLTKTGRYKSILDHTVGSKTYDSIGRTLTANTIFGGQAIIDLGTGSVKLTGAVIPTNMKLFFRATPRFVRVSEGIASNYRGVSMIFDDRPISETNFAGMAGMQFNNGPLTGLVSADAPLVDRYTISYLRTSTEGSEAAAPYLRTLRIGIKLPYKPKLNRNGVLERFIVNRGLINGTVFQVDPVNAALYTNVENLDTTVQVTYTAVDENGQSFNYTVTGTVGLVGESSETKIPMEQGLNESAVSLAVDPMLPPFNNPFNLRRPGLIWMVWTSQRAGTPDVFMQSVAPKFIAEPGGNK